MKNGIIYISVCLLLLCGCGNSDDTPVVMVNMPQTQNVTEADNEVSDNGTDNMNSANEQNENAKEYDGSGYTSFRGINVSDIEDYTCNAVIYYPSNTDYNEVTTANISFGDITNEMSGDRKIYNIPLTISMYDLYSSDNVNYSGCITPSVEFADDLTGGIIPVRDTLDNDGYSYGITFKTNDAEYLINYTCNVTVSRSDYEPADNGGYRRKIAFNAVYTVDVPYDYEGLIMKITPCNQYRDVNVTDVDMATHMLDDEMIEGQRFFRL